MNDYKRLVKNIVGLAILGGVAFLAIFLFRQYSDDELKIDDTPVHIESIRTIAEISTVSFKDEVVIDTVEFYNESFNMMNPFDWKEYLYDRNVKRRLTIIYRGEVKYGLDLTDGNYEISQSEDSLVIVLPKPELLDIVLTPSKTEVFQEQGQWSDGERKAMESQAKFTFKKNAEQLKLNEKAEENALDLIEKLIITDKKLIVSFE
jgi:hypothetical protein